MGSGSAALKHAWSLACPDWADRLRLGRSLVPDLPLNRVEAERAEKIFNMLRLPDVTGQPLMRDAAGDWFRDMVRAVFGSYDPVSKVRHIREFFTLVPKKNSKTTGAAGIMVTALLMNERPRAEFIIVAPTQDVSDLAFRQAVGMIQASPVLVKKFHIQDHLKKITYLPTKAFLKVKSFDPKIVTGAKPAGVLIDELHVIAQAPDADRVIGQLRGGMVSQPEAFLIVITTQSERVPAGVFKAELHKARKVRDGLLDAPILPMLYEFPPEIIAAEAWRDPANWPMVLPNLGRSITLDRLISEYAGADAGGEEEMRRWASQHLNIEIGLALLADSWAGAEFWAKRGDKRITFDAIQRECDVACVGIDGGGLDDLLGLAVIGRHRDTKDWMHWGRAWAHPIVLERRKGEAPRLRDLAEAGDLKLVSEIGQDVTDVADIVDQIRRAGILGGVGLDPHGIAPIVDALREREITGDMLVGISQGFRLNGAIKTAERKLADGTFRHGNQPMMAWCVGNAKVEPKGNAILITKQASGRAKIDPVMAMLNAVELMSRDPAPKGVSVYETRGLVTL